MVNLGDLGGEVAMNPKLKKILLWVFVVFFGIPLVLIAFAALFAGESSETESKSLACVTATAEDLQNIQDGLIQSSSSIAQGFTSEFSPSDIDEISEIFPTFTSPRIVAAQIEGVGNESPVGLWGIQDFDYGWRILALNQAARQYSSHGADIEDDSASGRVRSKMLDLSSNTTAPDCAGGQ